MSKPPQFSARTGWDLQPTRYATALAALRCSDAPVFDLTASNPTTCGFDYDAQGILDALGRPDSLRYRPDARGLLEARHAVQQYYAEAARATVSPQRIFLTASTSEAYSYLFRLHCDPGAEVLIAQPSYPLFQFLADLDDVRLVTYPLFYDHGWHLDAAALAARITPQTRAVIVVHPNNPTGHFTSAKEREALEAVCQQHGLALIVDEVFLDYALDRASIPAGGAISFAHGEHPVLTYVLSGLSKVAALPQMKAAWLAVFGPPAALEEASARLEIIADTFLSMNASVQHALPFLLANREGLQQQILSRVRSNLAALDDVLTGAPSISRLDVQAGWYAILRVPALSSGEELATRLLQEQRVVVHPGYFYGFHGDGWLVLSLLPRSEEFKEGVGRLVRSFQSEGTRGTARAFSQIA
ncbi:MAG: pyridoxal phosphate-dependent aminotransferase [Acidobacteriaceae bacterium]